MKIFKLISLAMCFVVLSCTTSDNEDVLTPQTSSPTLQKSELNFQETEFTISEEESEILNKLFVELQDYPDFFGQSTEDQIAFLATFLSQSGYNVDLKDYRPYLYQDDQPETELDLTTKVHDYVYQIDDYVLQTGINSNLLSELDKLEGDIISNPKITEDEVIRVKSDVALWKYLSTNEGFVNLYHSQLSPENGKTNWKCIWGATKFGLNFTLCVLGKVYACALIPLYGADLAASCKKEREDSCAGSGNPCCGVYCAQGYRCENGKCVKDLGSAPCSNCGDGEQCINGICEPL